MLKTLRSIRDGLDLVNERRAMATYCKTGKFRTSTASTAKNSTIVTMISSTARVISDSSFVSVCVGGVRCMGPYRGLRKAPAKAAEQPFGPTNNCSVPLWQMWLACFGPRKLRHMLLRRLGAASVRPSSISPANENGPATRLPRSSLKSSSVTKCETSVSVHGKTRRAF